MSAQVTGAESSGSGAERFAGSRYTDRPLQGSVRVPGDKSLSHRVALFAALAEGTSQVSGLLDSLDVRSTLTAVRTLGARVELAAEKTGLAGSITGPIPDCVWGAPLVDCGNSGTTARLLLGVLAGRGGSATLCGDESLNRRPMRRVAGPLAQMGATFSSGEHLPITVSGNPGLTAIDYLSPVASAQVKSAILLAGLQAQGITSVSEPHKSRDHTELLLPTFGVKVQVEGLKVSIAGGQKLNACDCGVPGDPSSAAFLLVAAALTPDSQVTVTNVALNPTRTGFLEVLRRMGADVRVVADGDACLGQEPVGDITVNWRAGLQATVIEAAEVPALIDEVPILALLATAAQGTTTLREVGELRVKESDRLAAIVEGLTALGCSARVEGDDLLVSSGPPSKGNATLDAYGDHRLAMTWLVAARAFALDVNVLGLRSVAVSYPGFVADLLSLGAPPVP
jgi:3-phosphoshikimate 1-carboxyvinyltransferase